MGAPHARIALWVPREAPTARHPVLALGEADAASDLLRAFALRMAERLKSRRRPGHRRSAAGRECAPMGSQSHLPVVPVAVHQTEL
jgi:hypothetical protein